MADRLSNTAEPWARRRISVWPLYEKIDGRAEYRRRRDFLVAALNDMGLRTVLPKGAFYVFPDIRSTGLSSEDFCLRLLNEHAVACVPGSAFGACGEGFVRMSYATSYEQIEVAARRIAAFVRSLK